MDRYLDGCESKPKLCCINITDDIWWAEYVDFKSRGVDYSWVTEEDIKEIKMEKERLNRNWRIDEYNF